LPFVSWLLLTFSGFVLLSSARYQGGNSKFSDPENPVRFVRQMELPDKAKVSVVEWLPFKDMIVHGRLMNTLLLAGDVKGQLHIIDSKSGTTILSLSSGHVGAVTAMVVTKRHDQTCTVATGGEQGDIRIHVISRPPRYTLKQQLDLKGTNTPSKAAAWVPLVRLITHFAPSTVDLLDGLGPAHLRANLEGPKAIESLDFIPRGKSSYNILASDSDGRLTVHLKNGSLIASRHLETSRPIQRHAVTKTWTALSLDKKLFIFEPRLRNVEPVTDLCCFDTLTATRLCCWCFRPYAYEAFSY
jgi:WD40 repeat protein